MQLASKLQDMNYRCFRLIRILSCSSWSKFRTYFNSSYTWSPHGRSAYLCYFRLYDLNFVELIKFTVSFFLAKLTGHACFLLRALPIDRACSSSACPGPGHATLAMASPGPGHSRVAAESARPRSPGEAAGAPGRLRPHWPRPRVRVFFSTQIRHMRRNGWKGAN